MFKPRPKTKLIVKVKGLFSPVIPYVARVTDSFLKYIAPFEQQSFAGYDTDSCWCLAPCDSCETQLSYLWNTRQFNDEAKSFFLTNGYCDQQGNFSLSERFHEILCGEKDTGGTAQEAWQSFALRGHIPRSQLMFTTAQAYQFQNQQQFDAFYFNPLAVTPAMKAVAQQFLKYVNIQSDYIGTKWQTPNSIILNKYLLQAPINLGIPIPSPASLWNQPVVQYQTGNTVMAHDVTLYAVNPDGSYEISDQYLPYRKTLAANYYLPSCYMGVVTAVTPASLITVPQPTGDINPDFLTALLAFFQGLISKTIQIGSRLAPRHGF